MREYGPDDRWPDHPKSWWRDVIDLARDRGWRLRTSSGHAWGTLVCPESCKIVIFSTGRGGESVAHSARAKIERCAHGSSSPAAAVIRHLAAAERLTQAAAELITRRACAADVEEMLELADEALSAARQRELLDLIDALPHEGADAPEPVLDEAEGHVRSAAAKFGALAAPVAQPLRARARFLRDRIDELRRRLQARPPNVVSLPSAEVEEGRARPPNVDSRNGLSIDN